MSKLDDILDNARYRVASNDVLKQEVKDLMLDLAEKHAVEYMDGTVMINLASLVGEVNAL